MFLLEIVHLPEVWRDEFGIQKPENPPITFTEILKCEEISVETHTSAYLFYLNSFFPTLCYVLGCYCFHSERISFVNQLSFCPATQLAYMSSLLLYPVLSTIYFDVTDDYLTVKNAKWAEIYSTRKYRDQDYAAMLMLFYSHLLILCPSPCPGANLNVVTPES